MVEEVVAMEEEEGEEEGRESRRGRVANKDMAKRRTKMKMVRGKYIGGIILLCNYMLDSLRKGLGSNVLHIRSHDVLLPF